MVKTVGIDKDILVTDDVRFVLETKDSEDCLINPYQITNVRIYFVNREFTDSSATEYQLEIKQDDLVAQYERIKQNLCIKSKANVKVASTSNLTLFGLQTVDGIQLQNNDRILVKAQNEKEQNGIYDVSESNWTRSKDCDTSEKVVSGMYVFSENGVQNIGKGWVLDTNDPISLGTTGLDFICFSINGVPSSPDQNSVDELNELKIKIENSKKVSSFFYKDANSIKTIGGDIDPKTGELFPAWLNPDFVSNELKQKISEDNFLVPYEENDRIIEGKFVLNWDPSSCREGDYFICWSWRPNLGETILSAHQYFSLHSDTSLTTSIPTHRTYPNKYEMLLERYLPEMFKNLISDGDLSPKVLKGLNDSVARGFTVIEDMANQIIDLFDANATHETLLPLLSNLFNLKLKSTDSTLWRRQIKKAVPNFKKKGSILGLKNALGDIGMKFNKITRLWQIKSNYMYQEQFDFQGSNSFNLYYNIILDSDNLELYFRSKTGIWTSLKPKNFTQYWFNNFVVFDGQEMTWIGHELKSGDSIRILYKFRNIPLSEQSKENHIKSLPLLDQRDERNQKYPPKNWNVKVIEEDDVYFDILIPTRHPFSDPIVWGRIRTEFPYSENAYNMDEYNGSKRDSFNPCDIDKEFIDTCGNCQSSKFNLYLEVEKLSDESFVEVQNIIEEFMPFHSSIHTFDLAGAVTEFIKPSEERIDVLLKFSTEDILLAGDAQNIFNRDVDYSDISSVQRDLLSSYSPILNGSSDWNGLLKNQKIILFSSTNNSESDLNNPLFKNKKQGFEKVNISTNHIDKNNVFESDNLLEVLGSQTKFYTVSSFKDGEIEVQGNIENSMIGPVFEYRISNKIEDLNVNISRADQIIFKDDDADFHMLGIVTQYDIDKNGETKNAWKLRYDNKEYTINNLLPDGSLLIKESSDIDPITGWQLIKENITVKSAQTGSLEIFNYGLVELNSPQIEIRKKIKLGDYLYLNSSGNAKRYLIKSFKQGENKFYISDYAESDIGGENTTIYRRTLENKVGQLGYKGLKLIANDNLENILEISNGINQNLNNINYDNIKENYLIFSNSKYYSILEIDGQNLTLAGPHDDFTTNGQQVEFMVLKFTKQNLEISGKAQRPFEEKAPRYQFRSIDRSGGSVITNIESETRPVFVSSILNSNNNNPIDYINQSESIDFNIEYKE